MKLSPLKNKTVTSRCFTGKVAFDDDIYLACEWLKKELFIKNSKHKQGKYMEKLLTTENKVKLIERAFFDAYNKRGQE